jgi:membrane fusion protein (multidrug efflux system)
METPNDPQRERIADRANYRDGFRDGFDEAERRTQKAEQEKKDDGKDGEKKPDDKESGDDKDGGKGDQGDKGHDKGDDEGDDKGDDKSGEKGGDKGDKGKDGDDKSGKKPLYRRPFFVAAVLLVVLVLIIVAIIFWRHSSHHETTDDAFIDGHASQVAAQVAGRVLKLYVNDNQHVDAGAPLLDIDSRDNDARIAQARGDVANAQGQYEQAQAQVAVQRASALEADASTRQAEADLTKAVQDLGRYKAVNPDAVPRQQVDAAVAAERQARAKRDAAVMSARAAHTRIEAALAQVRAGKAQVDGAQAQLDAAQLQGSYTHVVAPISGRIARRTVEAGNVISVGQPLLALVSDDLWVTANYKETQLTKMKPGQSVDIVVDAYPDVTFRGHVDSVQRATGAYFSMLPAENATGNYVKVVQRVPVKIVFDDDRIRDYNNYAIGPGMSVTPDVSLP